MAISEPILPGWIKQPTPLKHLKRGLLQSRVVLMGDHLVVFLHDDTCNPRIVRRSEIIEESDESTTLLAINLRTNNVQEAKIEGKFGDHVDYTLNKYKENQIIQFRSVVIDWITVHSFERIYLFLRPFKF